MNIHPKPFIQDFFDPVRENIKNMSHAVAVCYRTESIDTPIAQVRLVKRMVEDDTWAPLEHSIATFELVTDRGVSHELVRHRIASYCQESTRWCNYSKGKFNSEISVVKPSLIEEGTTAFNIWKAACEEAESAYFDLLNEGCNTDTARSVLPTCLATSIRITTNLREWHHILKLRTAGNAHPDMRESMKPILYELYQSYPMMFADLV